MPIRTTAGLDPTLPNDAEIDDDGMVSVGGCRLDDLARQWGTALYVVSPHQLRHDAAQWQTLTQAVRPNSSVHFASKALPALAVLKLFADAGLNVDVSTGGELEYALAAGFTGERILVHGNAKSEAELRRGVEVGVRFFVADNLYDIERLAHLGSRDQPIGIVIRVIPEVPPATHNMMATAHRGQKFGFEPEQLEEAVRATMSAPGLQFLGYHAHVGSQITDLEPFLQSIRRLASLEPPAVLDIGGGLGIGYRPNDVVPSLNAYCATVLGELNSLLDDDCHLVMEPGRHLVAKACVTVYRVETVKRGTTATFVGCDGGTSDNMEVILEFHPQHALVLGKSGPLEACRLVGKHCDSGDVLIRDVELANPEPGDLIALPATGAYSHAMASNYNLVPRPAMVFAESGTARVVVRRDTLADMMGRESFG